MNRRAGLSLAEVLIAMFVLTIGLLGVLSLFPLGAVRMAQAIKDDRCQNHRLNIDAHFHVVWKSETVRSDGFYRQMYPQYFQASANTSPTPPNYALNSYYDQNDFGDRIDPFTCAMENPNYPHNPDFLPPNPTANPPSGLVLVQSPLYPPMTQTPNAVISRGSAKKTYPVFVDPIGWNNTYSDIPTKFWIAGGTNQTTHTQLFDGIPRRSLQRIEWLKDNQGYFTAAIPQAIKQVLRNRYMILLEDIGFGRDGTPLDSSGNYTAANPPPTGMNNQVQRDGRYSCALLVRRPQAFSQRQIDMTVVVYSGRTADAPSPENAFTTRFIQDSTEATIFYDLTNGPKPNIRKNNWILDGTMVWQPGPGGSYNPNGPIVPDNEANKNHGVFYRVIDVVEDTEVLNGTTFGVMRLQLQEPAQSNSVYSDGTPYGLGVVMDNVVEVFPAKQLSPITRPVP